MPTLRASELTKTLSTSKRKMMVIMTAFGELVGVAATFVMDLITAIVWVEEMKILIEST